MRFPNTQNTERLPPGEPFGGALNAPRGSACRPAGFLFPRCRSDYSMGWMELKRSAILMPRPSEIWYSVPIDAEFLPSSICER